MKKRTGFNVIDLCILLAAVILLSSAVVREIFVRKLESRYSHTEKEISLSIKHLPRDQFKLFEIGDGITAEGEFLSGKLGEIVSIRSTPSVVFVGTSEEAEYAPDFGYVDMIVNIKTDCVEASDGSVFFGGKLVSPALKTDANNGKVRFNFEIISVNSIGA